MLIVQRKYWDAALSYPQYRQFVDELQLEGKTTGNDQDEHLVAFTKLNVQRMNRLDKTIQLDEEMKSSLSAKLKPGKWLMLGDAWCGDCAQIIPVIQKMTESAKGKIEFRIVSRDTFPELMDQFLTNGARSIPKLLLMDATTNEVVTTWGPRPRKAQEIMLHWKANQDTISREEFATNLHLWYTKDKGNAIVQELSLLWGE